MFTRLSIFKAAKQLDPIARAIFGASIEEIKNAFKKK